MNKDEAYKLCLEKCENNAPDSNLFSMFAHLLEDDAVNEKKIQRLEKEADWLALVLANEGCGIPTSDYIDQRINGMSPPAPEHWREAARKAVEEQCQEK